MLFFVQAMRSQKNRCQSYKEQFPKQNLIKNMQKLSNDLLYYKLTTSQGQ